ncbi:hypothetical protein RND81_05G271900 [Saponaria officinalis]|uniref:Transmembrane protein n=1 Tax=Saponaria officinalis TaxID=3572 RepID=A0AAW1L1D2_SAPOF
MTKSLNSQPHTHSQLSFLFLILSLLFFLFTTYWFHHLTSPSLVFLCTVPFFLSTSILNYVSIMQFLSCLHSLPSRVYKSFDFSTCYYVLTIYEEVDTMSFSHLKHGSLVTTTPRTIIRGLL